MRKYLLPLILLLVSVGVFFAFIDPFYKDVQTIRVQTTELDEALNNSKQIQATRDQLLERFNAISNQDLERIKKMLPDHVDNVKLILEIDRIASQYGMTIKDIVVADRGRGSGETIGSAERPLGAIRLNLAITGSYRSFLSFISDLERSLRIVDIVSLNFAATADDFNQYDLGIRTYWLK